jgi:hypothetical protein
VKQKVVEPLFRVVEVGHGSLLSVGLPARRRPGSKLDGNACRPPPLAPYDDGRTPVSARLRDGTDDVRTAARLPVTWIAKVIGFDESSVRADQDATMTSMTTARSCR